MDKDDYGEVINGEMTYYMIASALKEKNSIVIGWTDESSTHLDILFTLKPQQEGRLQGGLIGDTDLFVSVMRMGAFAFDAKGIATSPQYVDEKLSNGRMSSDTSMKVAELINNVRIELNKAE